MYVIIGSHFMPLEGKFVLVSYCKDNIKCDSVILTITNATSKNLLSSGTKWLPIMTFIHPLMVRVVVSRVRISQVKTIVISNCLQTGVTCSKYTPPIKMLLTNLWYF